MLDTSVALPATLSPRGIARKLWMLLALGSLTYEAEHRTLELDELRREAAATGGRLGGMRTAERLAEDAAERRAAMLEHLPVGTPVDDVAWDEIDGSLLTGAFAPEALEEDLW
jgi:predicted nucleic acid-binding protein